MNKKQKHTRRQNQWRQQNRHRMNMPPSPDWIKATMADLPQSSRLHIIYDANDVDALGQGPVEISNLLPLTMPLLPPPHPGWRQFGFTVYREEDIIVPDLGSLASIRWQFVLEWNQSHSAWDALLFSLDHLHLNILALPPTYMIPALFVACMADRPDNGKFPAMIAAWGPVLQEMCQALCLPLRALYEYWLDGPSTSAFRYRQFLEYISTDSTHYWPPIDPLRYIIGSENLEAIQGSNHPEATMLRQLLQASEHLWTREYLPLSKQELLTLLSTSCLRALLPLGLWSPPFPGKPEADIGQLHSLNDVLHLWKHHMTID